MQNIKLSKSLYTRDLQCVKSLWLKKYKEDVLKDVQDKKVFEVGNYIGELACELYTNGAKIPYENTTFEEKIKLTQKYLKDTNIENIFEATFEHDDVLVMVDILHKNSDGTYEIYEVKSSTWGKNKKLKDIQKYIDDVSVQYYVLNGFGLKISKTFIKMLNSEYVFKNKLESNKLFIDVDVSDEVFKLQSIVSNKLQEFKTILSNTTQEPQVQIGSHCNNPYECDAKEYCWGQKNIPNPSIFDMLSLNDKTIRLYESGVEKIEDIPDDYILTKNQQRVKNAYINKSEVINKKKIKEFLDSLTYPIYHLDFETYQEAVPRFNKQRPYQQIPFQYSLHIESQKGEIIHKEFLANELGDPRVELIKAMINDIKDDGCVLVYNESFEKSRLKELARDFSQYKKELMKIHDNIIDLMVVFKEKHYYHHSLMGRYSIKFTMPLLVPELKDAYIKLDLIHNGGEAMEIFPKLKDMNDNEMKKYRDALLKYCELDTWSMVMILEKLREMVK